METGEVSTGSKDGVSSEPGGLPRIQSARKLRYESEAQVVRNRLGNLEDIRGQLGLSRRAMCNLLLVDPSAWTRWTSPGAKAPPHIYRALEWYWYLRQADPKAALPIGSWGAQVYGERIRRLELELEALRGEAKVRAHKGQILRGLANPRFLFGVGVGVLGWLLLGLVS